jgi:hypothetical protein
VLESDKVFEQIIAANGDLFVDLPRATPLRHHKTHQQHRELTVPPGTWKVIRKTEFDIRSTVSSDPSQGAGAERRQRCPTLQSIWNEIGEFINPPEESKPTDAEPPSAPFYRGIPTCEIVRALRDFKLGGLVVVENPV